MEIVVLLRQCLDFAQTHVHRIGDGIHWIGDAFQLSHPLSSPSPPAFNLSQHQGLFQWVVLQVPLAAAALLLGRQYTSSGEYELWNQIALGSDLSSSFYCVTAGKFPPLQMRVMMICRLNKIMFVNFQEYNNSKMENITITVSETISSWHTFK